MDYRLKVGEAYGEVPSILLPGSKSIANRMLMLAAVSGSACELTNLPDCDDVRVMKAAIESIASGDKDIDVGAAGTAMRFLTAYASTCRGRDIVLRGTQRMYERPIYPLVDALRKLGAEIEYIGSEGYPPLSIRGRALDGGVVDIDSGVSSQFISALMMIGCGMECGMSIVLSGNGAVSLPYIEMTVNLMNRSGCNVRFDRQCGIISVAKQLPEPCGMLLEPDWSAASYIYEWASASGGSVFIPGLVAPERSVQGDSRVAEIFTRLGVRTEFSQEGALLTGGHPVESEFIADMREVPDLVPAVLIACCMAGVSCYISGISGLRIKESDRIEALREGLTKSGFQIEIGQDCVKWGGKRAECDGTVTCEINTYDDHRIAMSFAMLALRMDGIIIKDAGCVSKSWPGFWNAVGRLGMNMEERKL